MAKAIYSEGTVKVDGKTLHKSYIVAPLDLFVRCPYCAHEHNHCNSDSHVEKCEGCGKEFYAEFDKNQVVPF